MPVVLSRLPRHIRMAPALALLLLACTPDLVVHGIVRDAETGALLEGVHVALYSAEKRPTAVTGKGGYFKFAEIKETSGAIVSYSLEGYQSATLALEPAPVEDADDEEKEKGDGADKKSIRALDASIALVRLVEAPDGPGAGVDPSLSLEPAVGGWVYSGDRPAAGAVVALWRVEPDGGGRYMASGKSDERGRFDLAAVPAGTYRLRVLPYDEDGDGIADYRLYSRDLGLIGEDGAVDLARQVVVLEQPSTELLASSFVALSTQEAGRPRGYPVRSTELASGVTGVLRDGSSEIWLHWGAEVDTALTTFELRRVDASGRASAPLTPLAVTWEHDSVVHVRPPQPLGGTSNPDERYELRVTSLRFRSGASPFSPRNNVYGRLTFDVHALPELLPNPLPRLYASNRRSGEQTAARALVDASGLWLVDERGDFLGGYSVASHWTDGSGFQLTWPHVAGAADYRIYGRNTVETGVIGDNRTQWVRLPFVLNTPANTSDEPRTIFASGVMAGDFASFGASVLGAASPWAFGNGVQIAVAPVDVAGFESPIDPSQALTLEDNTDPMLASGQVTVNGVGAGLQATLELTASEPLLAGVEPSVTAVGAGIKSVRAGLASWNGAGSGTPQHAAVGFELPLEVRLREACTEITVARWISDEEGDLVLPVRNRDVVPSGAWAVALSATGEWLAQFSNVRAAGTDLLFDFRIFSGAGVTIPAGSLLCALEGGEVTSLLETSGTGLAVGDASQFAVGDTVVVVEPSLCDDFCSDAVVSVASVTGIDTQESTLQLSSALAPGHTEESVVFRWAPAAALRPAASLALATDVAGGPGAVLQVNAAGGVRVGDSLLVDLDGLEWTTDDQTVTVVKQILATDAGAEITADLPSGRIVVRGRATVVALGDGFTFTGLSDTSGRPLALRRNSVSAAPGGGLRVWGTNR